jgi:geranylgeranyl reductase family protein
MKTSKYDILVVGAGPAGASAAMEGARRNMRVLLVERRRLVGTPVQCAEYIPALLVGKLNLGKHYIVQSIHGIKTYLFNQEVKDSATPGFIVNRDIFDRMLVEAARREGADILLSTKAVSRKGCDVIVKPVKGQSGTVSARIIIGADGPLSTVGKWIGAVNRNLIAGVQVRVPLKAKLEFAEVYFDRNIYGGYAWLFPKGKEANCGLAMKKKGSRPPPLAQLLDHFISQREKEGKIENKSSGVISGWIPAEPARKIVRENVLLAGDAAGHTHPVTGAGIFPAVTAGRMAGKWAARAVEADDLNLLSQYEAEYEDLFGDSMKRAHDRRRLMEEKWDHLGEVFRYCWIAFKEYYADV